MVSPPTIIDVQFEAEDRARSVVCRYLREPGKTQARFENRDVLRPDLNLGAYRVEAVCDYAELVVSLARETQFRYVQDALSPLAGLPYVAPIGEGAGGVTSTFRIRV